MLQQVQQHFFQRHSPINASRGAVPAGRAGDGSPGPGFVSVPQPWQSDPLWGAGGWSGVPARWAEGVFALAAFLLSGREQWKLSCRQHWWDTFESKTPTNISQCLVFIFQFMPHWSVKHIISSIISHSTASQKKKPCQEKSLTVLFELLTSLSIFF